MAEFLTALGRYAFLQYAVAAGLLASVACGVVGSYVVTRRITYIAGSVSHCILAGIGAAKYLQTVHGIPWATPILGAVVSALTAALLIGLVSLYARQREDTVIGAVWAAGMAIGVLFIARTPGYAEDLMGYLFGNILLLSPRDLLVILILDAVVVGAGIIWYDQFLALCFDEEYARLRGLRVEIYYLLLLCMTAITVVLLVSVVGIILVIALLTLPAAIAGHFVRNLWQMMVVAALLSAAFTVGGIAASYGPNLPSGATIIVIAGLTYLLVAASSGIVRRLKYR
ncbi:MAG: metal ABC transporter permease [Candidatus Hydrogenedentes bacterium]|nr:metal ABC transporter permease [Candidatus Hydrogenedentota bacterium]